MSRIHVKDIQAALVWAREQPLQIAEGVDALAALQSRLSPSQPWAGESDFSSAAMLVWKDWYETTLDTPCIAICSTSQGDDVCKGCGRTFDEVIHWLEYTPMQKRETWQRIAAEGIAWRFTSYNERARE